MEIFCNAALLGLGAGIITWIFTSIGAATVFLQKQFSRRLLDIMLGFAGGVMVAASIWSLISPALHLAGDTMGKWRVFPVAAGFFLGALSMRLLDYLMPHIHMMTGEKDGRPSRLPRNFLLILAIILHNIPEALAVGVAFGASAIDPQLGIAGAVTLMLGIGIQNLPEGMAVSMPLLGEGMSKKRAFFYGQLSGIVEPVAALAGALISSIALPLLPWTLSFAAGAMIFVTVEEVIPESHASGNGDMASLGFVFGFLCMMCLDVVFA